MQKQALAFSLDSRIKKIFYDLKGCDVHRLEPAGDPSLDTLKIPPRLSV